MNLTEIKGRMQSIIADQRIINDVASDEKRVLSDKEQSRWDSLQAEWESLQRKVEEIKEKEEMEFRRICAQEGLDYEVAPRPL